MTSKKRKRLIYLVAHHQEGYTSNLEQDLRTAYAQLPQVNDRKVEFAGKTWTGLYCQSGQDFFVFQFALSVPGEEASTLPNGNVSAGSVEMGTTPPPVGYDFSEGDAICLVSGDHIFACLSEARDSAIAPYLNGIFSLVNMENAAVQISKMARYDKIRLIRDKKIKSIQTDAVLGSPEFTFLTSTGKEGLMAKIWKAFRFDDIKLAEAAEKAGMKVRISFSGTRVTKSNELGWFSDMGADVLENDNSYRIELSDGTVITPKDIRISSYESLERNGKSVFVKEAVEKLKEFKDTVLQGG